MANPIYAKNKDDAGYHLVWEGGIITHDALARIIPFLFEKIGIGDDVNDADCKIIARQIRNWARLQEIWMLDVDEAFFRHGMTVFMPPFIEKLEQNADKIESVIPGMKCEIREIYTKLNFSTFNVLPKRAGNDGINDASPDDVFDMMLKMAIFFEKSGGIIPEDEATDDDNRAAFVEFVEKKGDAIPGDGLIDAFIKEEIEPVSGYDPEYFEYFKKLLAPAVEKRLLRRK